MGLDMLEPHIKYLYGQLSNLFLLINHSQRCAKISSCTVFNSNATKRSSGWTDHSACLTRAARSACPPACVVARFVPHGFAPGHRVPRLLRPSLRAASTAPVRHVAWPCCTKSVCCKHMCQVFQMLQMYVQVLHMDVTKKKIWMLQWLYMYVASVYSKCFIYFRHMLQVFYLKVAYVAVAIHICCKHMFQIFHLF
jgi:hypothetical protein